MECFSLIASLTLRLPCSSVLTPAFFIASFRIRSPKLSSLPVFSSVIIGPPLRLPKINVLQEQLHSGASLFSEPLQQFSLPCNVSLLTARDSCGSCVQFH